MAWNTPSVKTTGTLRTAAMENENNARLTATEEQLRALNKEKLLLYIQQLGIKDKRKHENREIVIRAMSEAGYADSEIGEELAMSKYNVKKLRERWGIRKRKPRKNFT